jgi:DNA-binding ferritin-like protein (Dps family)
MSDTTFGGFIATMVGPKRRWRQYQARVRQLPPNHRAAVEAIQRHMMHFVPADADSDAKRFEDLAALFEQAAADGTPIREIVGPDPVTFAETFVRDYSDGGYVPARARKRLTEAIERAE